MKILALNIKGIIELLKFVSINNQWLLNMHYGASVLCLKEVKAPIAILVKRLHSIASNFLWM